MEDTYLSQHFRLSEFTRSATASARGIDNTLNQSNAEHSRIINNLRALCENVLEPLRQHFNVPIRINSGYRSPALNKAVGGAKRSYHRQGRAADIPLRRDWYAYIRDHLPHTELINEGTWIHVAL